MGKKKPTLKSNVARGFATTSVPKRESEQEASVPFRHDEKATRPTSPPPAREESTANAETEESSALQSLVDIVYPKVEKESLRKLKVRFFNSYRRLNSTKDSQKACQIATYL